MIGVKVVNQIDLSIINFFLCIKNHRSEPETIADTALKLCFCDLKIANQIKLFIINNANS